MTATERAMCTEAEDRIRELEAENERHMIQIGDLKALRTMLNGEIEQLRAGISWARGMCSDEDPTGEVDHFLGCVLAGRAQLPAAFDEECAP